MAEKRIKGITIEIEGNTKKLSESLKDVNKTINTTNNDLKDLQKALKLDPKNTELLAQKQELLQTQIKATTERLNTLKEAQRQLGDYNTLTDDQKENYRALGVEISKAESNLRGLNDELKKGQKFSLKGLNDSLSGVREKTTQLVKDFAKFSVALGGVLTAVGVSSVKAYAEYEQLVGGVETLFKDSSKQILQYANNAYKTAGLSASEYLDTITSFNASLIKSLGNDTTKSAKYADMAITDMSDNANKMGTDISLLQSAYQGFAKQNYTMLDNLKLGYGGTKTEMEKLIKDANEVKKRNGEMATLSINSFADMVEAIHIVQTEMGITGTTAKEADSTILGSVNSMKASWKNLLLAVSDDNADMGKSVDTFIDSVITAGKNIVPRIRVAIDGIKRLFNSLVRDVFPKLKREIPELKPLINVFEWFIDHKSLVMTAIKGIIGVFAVTKIVEFATRVQEASNKLIAFASGSVAGAVITAVGAIAGVVATLSSAFNNETEEERKSRLELEKLTEEVNEQVDAWDNLVQAQKKQMDAGMSELGYYDRLYNELKNITDENGNVKKGNEDRAEFIVGKLSEALGIEIDKEQTLADKIKGISDNIDLVIRKKKAEIILDSQKGLYEEALKNEATASTDLYKIQEKLEGKKREVIEAEEAYKKVVETNQPIIDQHIHNSDKTLQKNLEAEIERAKEKVILKQQEVDSVQKSYDKQEELLQKYIYNKSIYEKNMEEYHKGNVENMITTDWNYIHNFEDVEDREKAILEEKIKTNKTYLEQLKKAKEKQNTDMYDDDIAYYEKEIKALEENLNKYVSTFNGKKGDMTTAGSNFIEGAIGGMNSKKQSLFSTIVNIANTAISKFKAGLKEQSPSKATREMGQYLIEGLSLGIKDNEKALLNQVDALGNSVIGGIYDNTINAMKGLNNSVSTSLNPTINPSVSYELNYRLISNAMKEALKEVNVELDDREVGRFIDKTISEEVYN